MIAEIESETNKLNVDELYQELTKVNAELEKVKKQKRPFAFGNEVIESQLKRIQELEDKLHGWFVEKEKLTAEKEHLNQDLKTLLTLHPDINYEF